MGKDNKEVIENLVLRKDCIDILSKTGYRLSAVGAFTSPLVVKPVFAVSFLFLYLLNNYNIYTFSESIKNNEAYKELKEIYNAVLDDLIKLSKDIDNEKAIEHFALYNYLFRRRLLGTSKSDFEYHNLVFEPASFPELTINGHGVCRHTSLMGTDLFSKLGFETQFVGGHHYYDYELFNHMSPEDIEQIKTQLPFFKKLKPDLAPFFEEMIQEYNKFISGNAKIYIPSHFGSKPNHGIFKVNEDEHSYFFDVSLNTMYVKDEKNPNLLCNNAGHKIDCNLRNKDRNILYLLYKPIITYDTVSPEELQSSFLKATNKVVDNMDMLRDFRNNNMDRFERAEEIYIKSLKK